MSIATVISDIQTVNATITGVTSAPTAMPGKLNTADLPCALAFVGPGEATRISDFSLHHRTFYVRCYVQPVVLDIKPNAGYAESYALLQLFVEKYLSDITLGSATVQHMGRGARWDPPTLQDSGVVVMNYAGTDYHGFEITFSVKEQIV